jgi:hypothetical protein
LASTFPEIASSPAAIAAGSAFATGGWLSGVVSSEKTTLSPLTLPASSLATMVCSPSPDSVTVVCQTPPLPADTVSIRVVSPL